MKYFQLFPSLLILCCCNSDLSIVKKSTIDDIDKSVTIGNVFDNYKYFSEKSWSKHETEQKRKIVTFSGTLNKNFIEKVLKEKQILFKNQLISINEKIQISENALKSFEKEYIDGNITLEALNIENKYITNTINNYTLEKAELILADSILTKNNNISIKYIIDFSINNDRKSVNIYSTKFEIWNNKLKISESNFSNNDDILSIYKNTPIFIPLEEIF